MRDRKLVRRELEELYFSTESIQGCIRELVDIEERWLNLGYENIEIIKEYFGYDGGYTMTVMGYSPESDKEYETRIKAEELVRLKREKTLAKKEAAERSQYEKLKKKYGKHN